MIQQAVNQLFTIGGAIAKAGYSEAKSNYNRALDRFKDTEENVLTGNVGIGDSPEAMKESQKQLDILNNAKAKYELEKPKGIKGLEEAARGLRTARINADMSQQAINEILAQKGMNEVQQKQNFDGLRLAVKRGKNGRFESLKENPNG